MLEEHWIQQFPMAVPEEEELVQGSSILLDPEVKCGNIKTRGNKKELFGFPNDDPVELYCLHHQLCEQVLQIASTIELVLGHNNTYIFQAQFL